jgi:hypothetical protein
MSIGGISNGAGHYHHRTHGASSQQQGTFRALEQLAQALQCGNLKGAQSAFSKLQAFLPASFDAEISGASSGTATANASAPATASPSTIVTLSPAATAAAPAATTAPSTTPAATSSPVVTTAPATPTATPAAAAATTTSAAPAATVVPLTAATSAPAASTTTSSATTNPLLQDLQSLFQALQSGNLSAAQSAFAKLERDAVPTARSEERRVGKECKA